MHSGLLVSDEHVLNRVLFVERVVNVEDSTTRVAPEVFDAFRLKALTMISEPMSSRGA